MSENIQNTPHNQPEKSTEIDLGELFRMIGRGINRFFAFLRNAFLFILDLIIRALIVVRVHFIKFAIVGILSVAVGWFIDSRKPTVYGSNMIVKTNYDSDQQLYSNIKYYNGLVQQGDSTRIADIFGITKDQAGSIRGVYIEPMVTEIQLLEEYDNFMKKRDSSNVAGQINFQKFKANVNPRTISTHRIGLASLEKDIFKILQNKLVFLDIENDYIAKQKKILLKNLELEEKSLRNRLIKIDTLRTVYNEAILSEAKKSSQAQTQIQMSSSSIKTNELELFELDQNILTRLSEIEEELELNQNIVNVLSNFSDGIESPGFYQKYIYKIPFLTMALLLIFILLRELNTYLNTYSENKRLNA